MNKQTANCVECQGTAVYWIRSIHGHMLAHGQDKGRGGVVQDRNRLRTCGNISLWLITQCAIVKLWPLTDELSETSVDEGKGVTNKLPRRYTGRIWTNTHPLVFCKSICRTDQWSTELYYTRTRKLRPLPRSLDERSKISFQNVKALRSMPVTSLIITQCEVADVCECSSSIYYK